MLPDVVEQYAFGWNEKRVDAPDLDPEVHDSFITTSKLGIIGKHFSILASTLELLPDSVVAAIAPIFTGVLRRKRVRCLISIRGRTNECQYR